MFLLLNHYLCHIARKKRVVLSPAKATYNVHVKRRQKLPLLEHFLLRTAPSAQLVIHAGTSCTPIFLSRCHCA